eukprot:Clim_evm32s144 gene=Clim_evmTU32s144
MVTTRSRRDLEGTASVSQGRTNRDTTQKKRDRTEVKEDNGSPHYTKDHPTYASEPTFDDLDKTRAWRQRRRRQIADPIIDEAQATLRTIETGDYQEDRRNAKKLRELRHKIKMIPFLATGRMGRPNIGYERPKEEVELMEALHKKASELHARAQTAKADSEGTKIQKRADEPPDFLNRLETSDRMHCARGTGELASQILQLYTAFIKKKQPTVNAVMAAEWQQVMSWAQTDGLESFQVHTLEQSKSNVLAHDHRPRTSQWQDLTGIPVNSVKSNVADKSASSVEECSLYSLAMPRNMRPLAAASQRGNIVAVSASGRMVATIGVSNSMVKPVPLHSMYTRIVVYELTTPLVRCLHGSEGHPKFASEENAAALRVIQIAINPNVQAHMTVSDDRADAVDLLGLRHRNDEEFAGNISFERTESVLAEAQSFPGLLSNDMYARMNHSLVWLSDSLLASLDGQGCVSVHYFNHGQVLTQTYPLQATAIGADGDKLIFGDKNGNVRMLTNVVDYENQNLKASVDVQEILNARSVFCLAGARSSLINTVEEYVEWQGRDWSISALCKQGSTISVGTSNGVFLVADVDASTGDVPSVQCVLPVADGQSVSSVATIGECCAVYAQGPNVLVVEKDARNEKWSSRHLFKTAFGRVRTVVRSGCCRVGIHGTGMSTLHIVDVGKESCSTCMSSGAEGSSSLWQLSQPADCIEAIANAGGAFNLVVLRSSVTTLPYGTGLHHQSRQGHFFAIASDKRCDEDMFAFACIVRSSVQFRHQILGPAKVFWPAELSRKVLNKLLLCSMCCTAAEEREAVSIGVQALRHLVAARAGELLGDCPAGAPHRHILEQIAALSKTADDMVEAKGMTMPHCWVCRQRLQYFTVKYGARSCGRAMKYGDGEEGHTRTVQMSGPVWLCGKGHRTYACASTLLPIPVTAAIQKCKLCGLTRMERKPREIQKLCAAHGDENTTHTPMTRSCHFCGMVS